MTSAFRPPEEELYAELRRLRADVDRLNRMPSGENSIGARHIGVLPGVMAYHDGANAANSMTAAPPGLSHQNSGNYVSLRFVASAINTDNMYTASSHLLTVRTAGVYDLKAHGVWGASATGVRDIRFFVTFAAGGSTQLGEILVPNNGASALGLNCIAPDVRLAVGDTIELQFLQSSGGNLSLATSGTYSPGMSATWRYP